MKKSHFKVTSAEESSGFLLWQVTTLWQRHIKSALESVELSHSAFVLLASLLWFEENTIKTTQIVLVNHTKLDKMTVSKSLKALEKRDLLTRKEDKEDTRAKTIMLTAAGKEVAIKALNIVESIDETFFSVLSKTDEKQMQTIFKRLNKS